VCAHHLAVPKTSASPQLKLLFLLQFVESQIFPILEFKTTPSCKNPDLLNCFKIANQEALDRLEKDGRDVPHTKK